MSSKRRWSCHVHQGRASTQKFRRNRNLRALSLERVAQQDTAVAAILHCPTWDEELHGASTTTSRTARCPFPYRIQGPKCSAALVSISNDWQHCATQTPVRSAPFRPYSAALASRKNNDLRHYATQTPVRSAPVRPYSAALVAEKNNDLRHCAARPQYALPQYVETQPPLSAPATTGNTVQHSPGVRSAPIPRLDRPLPSSQPSRCPPPRGDCRRSSLQQHQY